MSTNNKKRRSQKACNFCHQRKMKCNNVTPQCTNCLTYEQECIYDQTPKRLRLSNDRIERLEEENQCLQAKLASQKTIEGQSLQSQAHMSTDRRGNQSLTDGLDSTTNMNSMTASAQADRSRSIIAHTVQELEFHGPSSLLFDETIFEQTDIQKPITSKASESVDSARLIAEAAAQREPPTPTVLRNGVSNANIVD